MGEEALQGRGRHLSGKAILVAEAPGKGQAGLIEADQHLVKGLTDAGAELVAEVRVL